MNRSSVHRCLRAIAACAVLVSACSSSSPPATTTPPRPASPTLPATSGEFPSSATTGVRPGVAVRRWTKSFRTSDAKMPTEQIDGIDYKVFDGYLFDAGTSGAFVEVDDPYVLFRNCRFLINGEVSNTGAMVQGHEGNKRLVVESSEFDGGPLYQRGLQSDISDIVVTGSRFRDTGESGVEKNDRDAATSLTVTDSFFTNDKGWPREQHVDGIEVGGASTVTIRHNTVLIEPFGGTDGDEDYVSNSALGLWAELGNVAGPVVVEDNLLAGGGRTIYIQQKSPYTWQGPVSIVNNTFDVRYGPKAAVWGPLADLGLPADLTFTGNHFSDGRELTLDAALHDYP